MRLRQQITNDGPSRRSIALDFSGGSSHNSGTSARKARANLAWGEAPGTGRLMAGGLKARAKELIPHKPLVEGDTILREQRPHLALIIASPMMRRLIVNVLHQCAPITQAHRKCCVPTLPPKAGELRPLRLNRLRGRHLQSIYQRRHRLRASQKEGNVNVVRNSAGPHTYVLGAVYQRREVRVHLASHTVLQKWPVVFRTKYQMDQDIRKRLRHRSEYNADLQSANVIAAHLGLRPRLYWHGPSARISCVFSSQMSRRSS